MASQAVEWGYAGVERRYSPRQIRQTAYYRTASAQVSDLPNVGGQTDEQKTTFHYTPPNTQRTIPIPTEAMPDVWKLERTWSNIADEATDWGYVGIEVRYVAAPRIPQEAYFLSAEGSVGDLPDLSGQTDEQKTTLDYRPGNVVDMIPEPTSAMPNVWRLTRVWSTVASQAVEWGYAGIARRFSAQREFQEAYYLAVQGSVSDLPDISGQTDEQKTNRGYLPPDTQIAVPVPTSDNPNVWKLTRTWSDVASQASDWAYAGIILKFDAGASQIFQEAFYRAAQGSVGDLPEISGQTDDQKTDIDYRPADVVDSVPEPSAAMPNIWRVTRHYSPLASQSSDWAYAGIVRKFELQRLAQEAFYRAADGSVGDLPNISGQTDAQKTDIDYRPANVVDSIPEPTRDNPNIWRLTRVWSNSASSAIEWMYAGIVQRYVPPPPVLPVFDSQSFNPPAVVVGQSVDIQLPAATIAGGEALSYSLDLGGGSLPLQLAFASSTRRIAGLAREVFSGVYVFRVFVASDPTRYATIIFTLNIQEPPSFGGQTIGE